MNKIFILLLSLNTVLHVYAGTPGEKNHKDSPKAMYKQAENYFNKKDFESALPLYGNLISLYPDNYKLNYAYGICLHLTSVDNTKSIKYLIEASKSKDVWDDVWYYLGRAYQLNGELKKSQMAYKQFLKIASSRQTLKWETMRQIEMCQNAELLLKSPNTLSIMNFQTVKEDKILEFYSFENDNRKLIIKTEEFLTPKDKTNPNCLKSFLSADGNKMVYASYGNKKNNHTDIYLVTKNKDGYWDKPQCLDKTINTDYDDAYPSLSEDGYTLYFSSKGHNSMGGYDIFKTTCDSQTNTWSTPENMGVPVNSFDDDFYYLPSEKDNLAYFSSKRGTVQDEVTVFKTRLHEIKNARLVVNGEVYNKEVISNRKAHVIITRMGDGKFVTEFMSNPKDGSYHYNLQEPGKYRLVVEVEGFKPLAQNISFSENARGKIIQTISVSKDSAKAEILSIVSGFEENISLAYAMGINEVEDNKTVSTEFEPSTRSSSNGLPPVSEESKDKLQAHFNEVHENTDATVPNSLTNLAMLKEKNMTYRVQIGTFMFQTVQQVHDKLKEMGFQDISYYTNKKGWNIFFTGHEQDIDSALNLRSIVINYGFIDSFITVFKNGRIEHSRIK